MAAPDPVIVANLDGAEAGIAQRLGEPGQCSGEHDLDFEGTVVRRSDRTAQVVFVHGQVTEEHAPGPVQNGRDGTVQGEPLLGEVPDTLVPPGFDQALQPCSDRPGWQLAVADRRRHRHHVRHQVEHGP